MRNRYTLLLSGLLALCTAQAQYCSPTFINGCFLWSNLSITAGSINWSLGANDCTISDYTALITEVNAGSALTMTVVNGTWCGCAVWVDWNNNGSFEDAENMHYEYVGGDPSYTYTFDINIPLSASLGSYRMRVIAPWGSDGFLDTNTNGYGPCGDYQYGNFVDLTLFVFISGAGVHELAGAGSITVIADAVNALINVGAPEGFRNVSVLDTKGQLLFAQNMSNDHLQLNTAGWAKGLYVVQLRGERGTTSRRVMVE